MSSRSERDRESTDPMDAALCDLAAHLDQELVEPTDTAARVRARIESERGDARRLPGRRRLLPTPAAIAAAIILVTTAVAAIPPARRAVADLLGLRGDRIELRQPRVPVTTAAPDALQLGRAVSLTQARARVPELLAPTDPALLFPARILADPRRPEVSFVFTDGGGRITTLITEWRADAGPFFDKLLGPRASLEAVTVNGGPGAWVSGPDHFFFYTDDHGNFVEERGRLAGNSLIWQQGVLTLRIEDGDLTRARALEIAASMR